VLAITGKPVYFSLGISCAQPLHNISTTMATKKTASKTTASTPKKEEETPKPVAKKAAKKAAVKKVAAKEEAAPAVAKKAPAKKAAVKPSLDVIARAAYLNYRRRVEQGLPGNSQGDWLEAERQFAE
jgi:LAS superfamily LD-carboxypeptidase LdcB